MDDLLQSQIENNTKSSATELAPPWAREGIFSLAKGNGCFPCVNICVGNYSSFGKKHLHN